VITLFYLHEQQLPEIAAIMDSNVNAVKVKLHRARKKLESALRGILQNEMRTL
jgi:DNA-directed RNA polymerase specialized sigma24 family protein